MSHGTISGQDPWPTGSLQVPGMSSTGIRGVPRLTFFLRSSSLRFSFSRRLVRGGSDIFWVTVYLRPYWKKILSLIWGDPGIHQQNITINKAPASLFCSSCFCVNSEKKNDNLTSFNLSIVHYQWIIIFNNDFEIHIPSILFIFEVDKIFSC